ncbi:HNH endonuclease [Leptospira sp. 201903070]|uniref:HNH endonuclease n=1 Tax=Leptospira ainlahdjerensis TaxID=2810033 RepID=A0ABS2UCS4_9LEPT|nr:HNH endonuclease signature motif containing protein [Leptospira ainlahdjerensis]MBM9578175.1 HNH endonuclease [Leptospira ainlahdjerensis]
MEINKHNLSRNISPKLKKKIREKAGFACVSCGSSLYQYEHVDPEFADAKLHDPDCITLLCGSCHDKVTRKVWSKEKIKEDMKKPYSKIHKYAFGEFDFYKNLNLELGNTAFVNCESVLRINNESIISIKANNSGDKSPPFLLSAKLWNSEKKKVIEIENNEWKAFTDVWDIEFKRKEKETFMEIKSSENNLDLKIIFFPPNGIKIDYLEMSYLSYAIKISGNELFIKDSKNIRSLKFHDNRFSNLRSAIEINNDNIQIGLA